MLWEYTADRLADALRRISRKDGADVYVITVFLGRVPAQDPRRAILEVLWNTERRYASRAARASAVALPDERWGIEFMISGERKLWSADEDPEGHRALDAWAHEHGLRFHDDLTADDDDLTEEELRLDDEMVRGLIALLRNLHGTGAVREAFGRDIPVTLVPQDCHAPYPQWNTQINPPELYALFGPYYESIWGEG